MDPLIPFDLWPIVASHALPYVYLSLCLTHPTIYKSIKHLKNNFFKSVLIKENGKKAYGSLQDGLISLVDFGVDANRVDVYFDGVEDCDRCRVSLRGLTSAEQTTFKYYICPVESFYGVFTEKGDIHCVVRRNLGVYYRNPLKTRMIERHIFSTHDAGVNVADDVAYFSYCLKSVLEQVDNGVMIKDDADFCAAVLLKLDCDVVETIMAVYGLF